MQVQKDMSAGASYSNPCAYKPYYKTHKSTQRQQQGASHVCDLKTLRVPGPIWAGGTLAGVNPRRPSASSTRECTGGALTTRGRGRRDIDATNRSGPGSAVLSRPSPYPLINFRDMLNDQTCSRGKMAFCIVPFGAGRTNTVRQAAKEHGIRQAGAGDTPGDVPDPTSNTAIEHGVQARQVGKTQQLRRADSVITLRNPRNATSTPNHP